MKKLICAMLVGGFLLVAGAISCDAASAGQWHGGSRGHPAAGARPGFHGPGAPARPFFGREHRDFHGGRHFRGPLIVGPAFFWNPFWAPFPYYAPPPVIVQEEPPVYIPQGEQAPQPYWYYCPQTQAYYPYVKECPGGWLTVVPPPAPPAQ